jgi:hypothetical protein
VRRCYNNNEQKNKITKQTLPIQAKTHMATSADVGKETRKKFRSANFKTTFGTRKLKKRTYSTKDRMQIYKTIAVHTS